MDTLTAMRVFLATVQGGSLIAASRTQGMSASAVSKLLAALEREVGAQLLRRTTRRIALTPAGTRFAEDARAILSKFDRAVEAVADEADEPRGLVRVTAPVVLSEAVLAPVLPRFWETHPQVAIELQPTDRVVNLVAEGFDVALRTGVLPDSTLVSTKLGQIRFVLCASREYVRRSGMPRRPSDLARHTCLADPWAGPQGWRFRQARLQVSVDLRPIMRCSNMRVVWELIRSHQGIGVLPMYLAQRGIEEGSLLLVLDKSFVEPAGTVHALHTRATPMAARIRVFLDFLRDHFRLP